MKKTGLMLMLVGMVGLCLSFGNVALGEDDTKKITECRYCGMDRAKFAHSRMLIKYEDGAEVGTCSIHCVAIDLAINIDKTPGGIMVGDYGTKKLIDAEKAFWVIGGSKMGVMTKRAKWAFEKKDDAEKFTKENGGQIATFDEAMKAAYEDMYADTKMIREKRKMRKMEHKK
jgi:nitrous oxide reductase accessory protein NosL